MCFKQILLRVCRINYKRSNMFDLYLDLLGTWAPPKISWWVHPLLLGSRGDVSSSQWALPLLIVRIQKTFLQASLKHVPIHLPQLQHKAREMRSFSIYCWDHSGSAWAAVATRKSTVGAPNSEDSRCGPPQHRMVYFREGAGMCREGFLPNQVQSLRN